MCCTVVELMSGRRHLKGKKEDNGRQNNKKQSAKLIQVAPSCGHVGQNCLNFHYFLFSFTYYSSVIPALSWRRREQQEETHANTGGTCHLYTVTIWNRDFQSLKKKKKSLNLSQKKSISRAVKER